jgi:exosortase family protein XrtM
MYVSLLQTWSSGVSRWLIDEATVKPAAWLANRLVPGLNVMAAGSHLQSAQTSVNVLFGCEGSDVLMLLWAAICAAPARWPFRLAGLAVGALGVFVLNEARVLALFFSLQYRPAWFGPLHGLVAPLFVVVAVVVMFIAWCHWALRSAHHETGSHSFGTIR